MKVVHVINAVLSGVMVVVWGLTFGIAPFMPKQEIVTTLIGLWTYMMLGVHLLGVIIGAVGVVRSLYKGEKAVAPWVALLGHTTVGIAVFALLMLTLVMLGAGAH